MLSDLSNRLHDQAKGWLILVVIALFALLANLPLADPALLSRSLDGRVGYTASEALSAVASYGDDGRVQMIWIHLADFMLVVVYTTMFSLSLSWLLRRSFVPESRMQKLNLVPVLGGLFDVLENIWIITLLLLYPDQPTAVAWLAAIFTMGKYIMGVVIVLLLVMGLVKAASNRFRVQHTV